MGRTRQDHMVNILLPVALLLMFAVSALAVLMFATRTYQSTTQNSSRNDSSRIVLSYVSEKVHRYDSAGKISIDTVDGHEVLLLEQEHGENRYYTLIYMYENELKELFVKADSTMDLAYGRTVMEISDFKMEYAGDELLRFICTDTSGVTASMLVAVRSGLEAA